MKCQVIECNNEATHKMDYEGSCGKPAVLVFLCKDCLLNMWQLPEDPVAREVSEKRILEESAIHIDGI